MNQRIRDVLARLEVLRNGPTTYWNVPRTTGEFLNMMVLACGARKVLEIGTSNGYSGLFMAEALSHGKGLLYTVESNRERFEAAARNFKEAGMEPFVRQILGHAPEIFNREAISEKLEAISAGVLAGDAPLPGERDLSGKAALAGARDFDLVFMDATKMEYKSHLEAVLPRVRPGGLIIADNCTSHSKDLKEFFEFVEKSPGLKSLLLPFDSGLMMIFKLL